MDIGTNQVAVITGSTVLLSSSDRGCDKARCQFMNGTNRATVPLVSFPGSGNTWMRGLLEKATGICTGMLLQ